MKWIDLLRLSLQNLWRRKLRTILTMVAVMIGTVSIVVMVSIGAGINQGYIESMQETGELTRIELYNQLYYDYGGGNSLIYLDDETTVKAQKLDNTMIRKIQSLDHVVSVTPIMSFYQFRITTGKYESGMSLQAIAPDALTAMDIKLSEGSGFTENSGETIEIILGEGAMRNFYNPKSKNWTWEAPDIDWLNAKFTVTYMDYSNLDDDGNPKEYAFKGKVVGIMPDDGSNTAYAMYTNIDTMLRIINKNKGAFKNSEIKTDQYESGYVRVDDMNNVMTVQNEIKNLGINAYSSMQWIEQMQEQSRSIQLMLGGIGAVAMLVAAISIMNTMLMSIYERTREIGVMKVLGCRMSSIGMMFLTEAGFIGLGGGAMGLGLSFIISYVINVVMQASGAMGGFRSVISIYLAVGGVAFAVLIGIVSGLYPSQRAMRLSALAAIRTE